jgi:hypothetical protein
MAQRDSSLLSLLAHPDFRSEGVRRVAACARAAGADLLRFQYVLEADPRRVRIPPAVAGAGRADALWAHTCFEAFVGLPESPRYLELNFSPSGEWAAYRFDSYREGMAPALSSAPRLALRLGEESLELDVEVHLGGSLSCAAPVRQVRLDRRLRLALSAVVEDREGRLSYWALRHPPGRPDFHHPESFSLALELRNPPLNSP